MSQTEIENVEQEIHELIVKLEQLHKALPPVEIKNYNFRDLSGEVTLLDLFADKEGMFVIHNMGQGCRFCTLWADGLNGFLPHLESDCSVVLVSKDTPEEQRRFANTRGWRYRMASHGGGPYIVEQSVRPGEENQPGIVFYQRSGDKIFRKNRSGFGPGDLFCSQWNLLSLAGVGLEEWTPQYSYWKKPGKLDDGEKNLT